MLISEQILLLITNDKGKNESSFLWNDMMLAGGLLADLTSRGLATVSEKNWSDAKVNAAAKADQVEDPVLRHGVESLEKRPNRSAYSVLTSKWFAPRDVVAQHLIAEGVLEKAEGGFLFFTSTSYPTRDGSAEQQLRARLQQILHGQGQPTEQESTLIAILQVHDAVPRLLKDELHGMNRREIKQAVEDAASLVTDPATIKTLTAVKKSVDAAVAAAASTTI